MLPPMPPPPRRWTRSPQPSARGAGFNVGLIFGLIGLALAVRLLVPGGFEDDEIGTAWLYVGGVFVVAIPLVVRGVRLGRHAAFLREHGLELVGRVTDANRTGIEIGDIPLFRLTLEIDGPSGPYTTTCDEVLPPEDVAAAIGSEVRVRANPSDPKEVILVELV